MEWTVPGTVLVQDTADTDKFTTQLESVFLMGGVSLSQLVQITGLEAHTIQNWVRRGFLSPPVNKRYSLRQLCRILNIHLMQRAMTMESICSLLGYINGRLDDEGDDLIDDAKLYFLFLEVAKNAPPGTPENELEKEIRSVTHALTEKLPGANARIQTVLGIMVTAWQAGVLCRDVEKRMENL